MGDDDFDLIHKYSRAEALCDGVLHDVSPMAAEAGFRFPVAVTAGAWAECVALPAELRSLQDERGRLWDVLWMAVLRVRQARRTGAAGDVVPFDVRVLKSTRQHVLVTLVCRVGPGDDGEPVVTIMLPNEF
ncbi:DUF6573 family protein [Myxococcus sp. MISCRS1]|uniref:DUF6573 family protein n=1 Tax=Myxococcus sp. MISCRS1 TaxID=2996786 RepID=UPI003B6380A4